MRMRFSAADRASTPGTRSGCERRRSGSFFARSARAAGAIEARPNRLARRSPLGSRHPERDSHLGRQRKARGLPARSGRTQRGRRRRGGVHGRCRARRKCGPRRDEGVAAGRIEDLPPSRADSTAIPAARGGSAAPGPARAASRRQRTVALIFRNFWTTRAVLGGSGGSAYQSGDRHSPAIAPRTSLVVPTDEARHVTNVEALA
jgi:hypothetical protein